MTTIEIFVPAAATGVASEAYGDYGDDYDTAAIDREWRDTVEGLARATVPSLRLHTNKTATVSADDRHRMEHLDWDSIIASVDLGAIMDRHLR